MWDFIYEEYDKKVESEKKKLRIAWRKFYVPLKMSHSKLWYKIQERVRIGKYPESLTN